MLTTTAEKARWMMRRGQITAELAAAKDDQTAQKRALADLRGAAEMSGYNPGMVSSLLAACRRFEAYDPGIEFYEKMPAGPERRTTMVIAGYAGLLAKKGLAAQALEHYRMAAQSLQGQADSALYVQAIAGDAVDAFGGERAIELFRTPPDDQNLLRTNQTLLAIVLSATGHHSEAATLFRQLLQAPPDDVEKAGLSLLFGAAADQAGDVQQAKQCYEQVVKLEPANWVAHNNLAYLLCAELQQCEEALPYAERAVALNDEPMVEDTLATVFIGLGRYPQAVGILVKAIQRDPTFVAGYTHLGDAYRRLGRFEEAQKALGESQTLIDIRPELYADEAAKIKQLLDRVQAKDSSP
jgi:tetratricopeptide (TPR) repeat protein